jgi:hypothetical protein
MRTPEQIAEAMLRTIEATWLAHHPGANLDMRPGTMFHTFATAIAYQIAIECREANHPIFYKHAHEAIADRNSVREEIAAAMRGALADDICRECGVSIRDLSRPEYCEVANVDPHADKRLHQWVRRP